MNSTIYGAIDWVLGIIEFLIFIRVIISWLPIGKDSQFIHLLYQFTEPILAPIRLMVEKSHLGKNTMMDFSPILAILLIGLARNLLRGLLF